MCVYVCVCVLVINTYTCILLVANHLEVMFKSTFKVINSK